MFLQALTLLHIFVGIVAITSGFIAFLSKKGFPAHRKVGNVFFVTMLISALSGVILGLKTPVALSVVGGLLVFYLVLTSWITARYHEVQARKLAIASFILALIVISSGLLYGIEATHQEDGLKDGFPAILYFIYGAAVGGIAAIGDLVVIVRGRISGAYRIMRHLWRMGFALYIATASFLLGQPEYFPESIRGTLVLAIPVIAVVALTLFWLVQVLVTNRLWQT